MGLADRQRYFNGISAKRGRGWTAYMPVTIQTDGENAIRCAVPALALVTVNDARTFAESPLDTPANIRWENLRDQTRLALGVVAKLLDEAVETMGQRPWGVGLLGFVPEQLRAEQLEVVRRVKPSLAIIAGGRPGPSAELEAQGLSPHPPRPSPGIQHASSWTQSRDPQKPRKGDGSAGPGAPQRSGPAPDRVLRQRPASGSSPARWNAMP